MPFQWPGHPKQKLPLDWYGSTSEHGAAPREHRCFVWSGAPPVPANPTAALDIDGVMIGFIPAEQETGPDYVLPALPGCPVQVETQAAVAAGDLLEVTNAAGSGDPGGYNANGRVKTVVSGKAVLRALEAAAGARVVIWAVFTSGR